MLLLNVARGGIIDEQDLADALRAGTVAGAGIDVFTAEPPTGNPLLDAPNTLLTPHLGASTAEAQVAVAEEVAEQILEVLDGRPAAYAVNAPLLTARDRPGDRALPAARRDPRPVRRPSSPARAPRTLTLEIAGEPAGVRRLVAGRGGPARPARDDTRGAGQPRQRRRRSPRRAGITVVERKTPDAGTFSSLLTLTAEADGRTVTLAGTVANGEPRLVRLQEHAMDLAPADVMLITHHRDRPGTVGRVGALLGAADVNISSMTLARSAPRADAYMVLALDDDVPDSRGRGDPGRGGDDRHLGRPAGQRPVTDRPTPSTPPAPPLRRSSPRASTRRSSCSGTARPSGSSGDCSRARARRPVADAGGRQAELAGAAPRPAARLPHPARAGRPARRDRPLAALADRGDRACRRRGDPRRGRRAAARTRRHWSSGPTRACSRSAQGDWEGVHQDEIARRWPEVLARLAAPAVGDVGARRRVPRRRSRQRVRPALAADPRAARPRLPARHARPPAGRRLPRRRARTRTSRGRSSWATTGCSRSRC